MSAHQVAAWMETGEACLRLRARAGVYANMSLAAR
eukprot:CAMPEP_0183346714 /NCGR_PEP_ID=MMETSP0164_2-20130417/11749_1 /TAXON_ID=221442 /ORGANISM="Coccolithus pelagicus ssp braarudi, Strain PLY182g" /LENGTH=34 /DNA_ID= /DNA_START= /DNA_END= /DNA_ORIENTATION=